eukprot:CAMPEP_0168356368 /NCGR_PEP_ID=MMETSP0213-20121227/25108_1 /TAXON_ID=151035 /ORGANISM="Euplotes harpa, Strain FSP1.4" /LENGTH=96 /DNA_ID=CAMNT_0008368763 /DNA_START=1 /DNA_END=291 /DNA_ORIENTATION=+
MESEGKSSRKELTMDVESYDSEYWYPESADFIKSVQLDPEKQRLFHEFALQRRATGALSERVSLDDEKQATQIFYEEYRQVHLSKVSLEYIDNDPK